MQYSKKLEPGYLVLLTTLSFGLYSLYWFYTNWRHLEGITGKNLRPGLRTAGLLVPALNIYLIAEQWKQIHDRTRDESAPSFPLAWTTFGFLLLGYAYAAYSILLVVVSATSTPLTASEIAGSMYVDLAVFSLLGLLAAVPQRSLNHYWSRHENHSQSNGLTPGQIAWIVLGGLAWAITALQPFFVQVI